jgi:hypothetical protein
VGDALSDMLAIEAVLAIRGWSLQDWDAIYSDLPSRQRKLPVADRGVVVCSADETQAYSPQGLQTRLTSLGGRCFVRPSGTGPNPCVVTLFAFTSKCAALGQPPSPPPPPTPPPPPPSLVWHRSRRRLPNRGRGKGHRCVTGSHRRAFALVFGSIEVVTLA